jgi:hypothetical protein
MVQFILRTILLLVAYVLVSIYAGIGSIPLFGGIVFICIWLCVRDMKEIGIWIIVCALCLSIMWYDQWGVFFCAMIISAYVFDAMRTQLVRSNNAGAIWLFLVIQGIALIADFCVNMIYAHHVSYGIVMYGGAIALTACVFIILLWGIGFVEKIIRVYAHDDARGHV